MAKYDLIYGLYGATEEEQDSTFSAPPIVNVGDKVKDEGTTVGTDVRTYNFIGPTVTAVPQDDGSIDVIVSSGTAAATVTLLNITGGTIFKNTPVSELAGGRFAPLDSSSPVTQNFLGVVLSDTLNGNMGEIQIGGIVVGALASLGFSQDEPVFNSTTTGAFGKAADVPTAAGTIVAKLGFARGSGSDLEISKETLVEN